MHILEEGLEVSPRNAAYEPVGDELFQLTLTEANKAEIFDYGLSKLRQSEQEALQILTNLARWDPEVRSWFTLRSTSTVLDTPFRLVFLNADLESFDETGLYVRQYMVVSYCWRSKDFLPHGCEKHGSWPISKAFVDAIIAQKNHPRVGIWMDQLCIDQGSAIDKQKSVAVMDVIYRSCLRLLVLLEDVFLTETEIGLFDKYDPSKMERYDPAWRPPVEEEAVLRELYSKVTAARWWQRAWCFHEFSVNEPWSDKRQCNEIHNATFIMNGPLGSTVSIKWWTLHYVLGMAPFSLDGGPGMEIFMPVDIHRAREPGWRSSLMARHNHTSRKECLILEDKISIMINMCGVSFAYKGPSLKNTDEVLYISTLLALAAGETYPLTLFDSRVPPMLLGAASWLQQRLTQHGGHELFVPRFKPESMSGIYSISMQYIELDMVFLPAPATWVTISDADFGPTYDVFPDTISTTPPATHGPVAEPLMMASSPDDALDGPRRRFLAGCIMNGHHFTARLWEQLKLDVVEPHCNQGLYKNLTPSPLLLPAAQRLLAQLLPVSALLQIPPPPMFSLGDAQLFLTWLTDPRSMYYIGIYTNRIPCTIAGDAAFSTNILVNKNWKSGPIEELQAAVPMDLLNAGCVPFRIWLLRPGAYEDGKERWRLVGKSLLLGEPALGNKAVENKGRNETMVKFKRVVVGG